VPGWDALDLPWRRAELVVLDVETTGLDLRNDEIVSYGAAIVSDGRIVVSRCEYSLVRPVRTISAQAAAVHAITLDELAAAPEPAVAAQALADLLVGRVLVAHAAWVERAFLSRLWQGIDLKLDGPVLDTAALARAAGVVRGGEDGGEPQLESLARTLKLPVHTPHHALGDALTTAGVLQALLAKLDGSGSPDGLTVRELADLSRRHSLQ
jgi:DNA polymerase III subunit epsilon